MAGAAARGGGGGEASFIPVLQLSQLFLCCAAPSMAPSLRPSKDRAADEEDPCEPSRDRKVSVLGALQGVLAGERG